MPLSWMIIKNWQQKQLRLKLKQVYNQVFIYKKLITIVFEKINRFIPLLIKCKQGSSFKDLYAKKLKKSKLLQCSKQLKASEKMFQKKKKKKHCLKQACKNYVLAIEDFTSFTKDSILASNNNTFLLYGKAWKNLSYIFCFNYGKI